MEKYGKVALVNLPKKEDGKLCGYGFVTYETMNEARNAMEELNARKDKLLGTKVAVDWCLPKNLYLKNTSKLEHSILRISKVLLLFILLLFKDEAEKNNEEDKNLEENENQEDEDEEEENEYEEDKDGDDDNENDEDDESEEEKENKKQLSTKQKTDTKKVDEKFEKKIKDGTKDVQEKRTVFVRNLSYDANEDQIKEAFSKFGPVKFVRICYDRDLERPRGTAFIQFETKEGAMNACAESDMFEMDERVLQIDMAISRNQANDIVEEKKTAKHEPKDNRNLALAKEGVIYPNSYEARDVSKADMIRRQKLEKANSDKLKLLHYFVSPTRLSVHNLPISCSDEELRNIFLKAIGVSLDDKKKNFKSTGLVECRIMRDMTRVNSEGVARSKGYGFIELKSFELAKKALHATNNNPNLFKNGQRLIVQFSIEDLRALNKKKKRIEKSKSNIDKNNRFNKKENTKRNDKNNNNKKISHLEDDSINLDKMKQKNLLKVHNLEKKLDKRKNEEEKRQVKKQKRQHLAEKKMVEKETNNVEMLEQQRQLKQAKRLRLKENRKINKKLKEAKNNQVDDVDRLVDKLYQSKSKKEENKKAKWYE